MTFLTSEKGARYPLPKGWGGGSKPTQKHFLGWTASLIAVNVLFFGINCPIEINVERNECLPPMLAPGVFDQGSWCGRMWKVWKDVGGCTSYTGRRGQHVCVKIHVPLLTQFEHHPYTRWDRCPDSSHLNIAT